MDEDKSYLVTGHLPSIEDAIRSRNMKRQKLIRGIRGINKEIVTLRARRRRLIAASTIGKTIIAPIQKIPVEVLEEIFFQCIPLFLPETWDAMQENEHHPRPQDICKLLGNVCEEWRTIINDAPRLWSSLVISMETLALEDVYHLLKKSKSHPLDIFLKSDLWRDHVLESTDIFAMLHRELWRIRTLSAFMGLGDELFPSGFSLHAPLMQSFTLSRFRYLFPDHDMDLGGVYCPELRSVNLIDSDNIIRTLTANPMKSVRHLRVSSGPGPNALYLQFLNSLPHLVSLHWCGGFDEEGPLEGPLAVTLLSLKNLHVDAANSTTHLLSHFHTPSLESLELLLRGLCDSRGLCESIHRGDY